MNTIALLFLLLFTKHFIVDFLLQTPYQYLNKGKYGHLGGILHSWMHGVATVAIMMIFTTPEWAVMLGLLDAIIHYHVDWAKVKINTQYALKPDNSEKFWWLLGFDQYLHSLTYLLICCLL